MVLGAQTVVFIGVFMFVFYLGKQATAATADLEQSFESVEAARRKRSGKLDV